MPAAELPALTVASSIAWRQWLAREATTSKGVWLTLAKKGITDPTSLTYLEALDEAICHGWIDGQSAKLNDITYKQRFTPRTPKGMWSKRNVGFVERLEREGRMQLAGIAAVEAAKADGRWDAAYEGPAAAEAPGWFMDAVRREPKALETWEGLNKGNRYAMYMRLVGLKTEAGRERRTRAFVEMLAKGETLVPQKMEREVGKVKKTAKKPSNGKVAGDTGKQSAATDSTAAIRKTRSGRAMPSYVEKT